MTAHAAPQPSNRATRFSELIGFRVEPGFNAAVVEAARRKRTSASELMRTAIRAAVQSEGVAFPAVGREPGEMQSSL